MRRKIVIPFPLLFLMLAVVIASLARLMIFVMNPMAKDDQAWGGSVFAGMFIGMIVAHVIANAWPETQDDSANMDRSGVWAGFSIEISGGGDNHGHSDVDGDGSGDGGSGDGGGGDGGGGGGK
jgi:uncharacterized membrane protein YgcG